MLVHLKPDNKKDFRPPLCESQNHHQAHGEVVSHPLCMRKALGPNPSVSTCSKQTKSNQANCGHSAVSFLFERRIPKRSGFQPKSCHWNWMSVWMRRWVDSRMSLEALSAIEILTTYSPRNLPVWDTLAGARLDAEQAQGGGSRLLSRSLWC